MNNKHYIGKRVSYLELYDKLGPVTGVALILDAEKEILSGDETGYVLEIQCPYGTQSMADNILASVQGHTYLGYRARGADLDPLAELGDGVTLSGRYSLLAHRVINWGPGHMSEIAAPGESTLEHEYSYESPSRRDTERKIAETRSMITKTAEEIRLEVEGLDDKYTALSVTLDGVTVTDESGMTLIKGSSIETETLQVKAANITGTLTASQIVLTGAITWDDLASDAQTKVTSAQNTANGAASAAGAAYSTVSGWTYTGSTKIDGSKIMTGTVRASILEGGVINLLDSEGSIAGTMTLKYSQTNALDISSAKALRMQAASGYNAYLGTNGGPSLLLTGTGNNGRCQLSGGALVISSLSYGSALPSSGVEGQVYFVLA